MTSISLNSSDNFQVLTMHNEGRFNPESLAAFNDALDTSFADPDVQGLIITGEEKIFAQGLDLEYISSADPDISMQFVHNCMVMVGRLLCSPIPIVNAVNGHAFGLGAMITLAGDYSVMRDDRGYFCLPEVDLGMNLIPPMNALVTHKLSGRTLRDSLLTGKRIGGTEAKTLGIVDECCSLEQLLTVAKQLAEPMLGKNRDALAGLKRGIHLDIMQVIEQV